MSWLFFFLRRKTLLLHFENNLFKHFHKRYVTHPTGQFPNETYINGLRDNPESTLAVVYDEFRQPIIQTLTELGEQEETAAQVFQLAVFDAARLARSGQLQTAPPIYDFLSAVSLAQLQAINAEEEAELSAIDSPEITRYEPPLTGIPAPDDLLETRNKFEAWRQLQQLEEECRRILLSQSQSTEESESEPVSTAPDRLTDCQAQYAQLLGADLETDQKLPDWALNALADTEGYSVWRRTNVLEKDWAVGAEAPPESNRIWRWAVSILLLVSVGYGIYQFYFRPKTAAEVFADNFAPPTSFIEDMEQRYGAEMGNDSVSARPNDCMLLLQEADAYYQANEFLSSVDPLLLIVLDSASLCQSDAWYYLGIVQLQLEDPTTAIQCFAKIEDLGRYGQDLYWYQALAFVQLAKENPLLRDKARRAVERTLGNARDPKRRKQAETMLENLSK